MFGSHKIAPRLSPNKTLEGLIGGFLIGTLGFWFAGLYQDWLTGVDALIIGAAVAAAAPVGDLFESMIKRDLGRKDTGTLFGPHGGLLDRLDAVFFTIVVGYYLACSWSTRGGDASRMVPAESRSVTPALQQRHVGSGRPGAGATVP